MAEEGWRIFERVDGRAGEESVWCFHARRYPLGIYIDERMVPLNRAPRSIHLIEDILASPIFRELATTPRWARPLLGIEPRSLVAEGL